MYLFIYIYIAISYCLFPIGYSLFGNIGIALIFNIPLPPGHALPGPVDGPGPHCGGGGPHGAGGHPPSLTLE